MKNVDPSPTHDETLAQINWDQIEKEATLLLEEQILEIEAINPLIQQFARVAHQTLSLLQYALKNRIIDSDQFIRLHKKSAEQESKKSTKWTCLRKKNQPPVFETTLDTFGSFKILSTLGRGGMGVVYKALDTRLNRVVALKMLREENLENKKSISRFLQEGKSAAKLSHPNIVPVYELGEISGIYYISMKYLEGETLDKYLKQKQLSTRNKILLILEIAEALYYAHQNQIIHRDLKPSNILVDLDDHPHLMDFGLAKDLASETKLTRTGEFMGTPRYMSPEQVEAKKEITAHVDQFALGVIFYEMLTNRVPFHGTQVQVFNQIIRKNPTPPAHLVKTLPKEMNWICMKLLEKRPQDRYHHLGDLIQDLRTFLEGKEVKVSRVHVLSSQLRRLRRNLLGLFISFLLLIIVVMAWFFIQKQQKENKQTRQDQLKSIQIQQEQKKQETLAREKIEEIFLQIVADDGLLRPQIRKDLAQIPPAFVSFFLPYLKDERSKARKGVLRVFQELGWKEGVPEFKKMLTQNPSEEEVLLILKILKTWSIPFAWEELQPFLQNPSEEIQYYAVECCFFLPMQVDILTQLLSFFHARLESYSYLCFLLVPLLNQYKDSLTLEAFKHGAVSENSFLREACLSALADRKYPEIVSLFKLEEMNTSILLLNCQIIARHQLNEGLNYLKKLTQHSHLKVALAALEALTNFSLPPEDASTFRAQKEIISKKIRGLTLQKNQAKRHLELQEYGEALAILNQILLESSEEELFYWRSKCLNALGKYMDAVEDLLAVIQRDPKVSYYVDLGNACSKIGMHTESIKLFDKALSMKPDHLEALQDKGLSLLFEKRVDEAIVTLEKALNLDIDLIQGYQLLGQAYTFKKLYQKAIRIYRKALEIDPSSFAIYTTLGNVYLEQNLLKEARECFLQSIQLNPSSQGAVYLIGETYFRENDYDSALKYLTQSLEEDPEDVNTLIRIAEIEWFKNQPQEAHRYLDAILQKSKPAYALVLKAKIFMEDKQYEKALEYLLQVEEKNADRVEVYVEALYRSAQVMFQLSRYTEAFDYLKKAQERGYPVPEKEWSLYQSKSR